MNALNTSSLPDGGSDEVDGQGIFTYADGGSDEVAAMKARVAELEGIISQRDGVAWRSAARAAELEGEEQPGARRAKTE